MKAKASATSVPVDRETPLDGANSGRRDPQADEPADDEEGDGDDDDARPPTSTDTEPSVTSRTTTVRTTRPMTSSATAAPSTIRASVVARARRSPKTRAVMPTLVAVSAAPTNSAVLKSSPISAHRAEPEDHRRDHADGGHEQRRPADLAELAEVHLHADLEQEQDHADLAEGAQHLVAVADQRRAPTGR